MEMYCTTWEHSQYRIVCKVTDRNQTYCGGHFKYTNVNIQGNIPETNIILWANYPSKNKWEQFFKLTPGLWIWSYQFILESIVYDHYAPTMLASSNTNINLKTSCPSRILVGKSNQETTNLQHKVINIINVR